MEIELHKKSDDDYVFKNALFFCKTMQGYGNETHIRIPEDVATVILQKSYLVRKKEAYEKFNPFFRFHNDSYHKMKSDLLKNMNKFVDENPDMNDDDVKRFHELYPDDIHLNCRQFDIIQPDDLIFFTKKQDEILSSLLFTKKQDGILCLSEPRLKPFHNNKGYFSLQLPYKENEQYVMLPDEFKNKIEAYPKFVFPNNSCKISLHDEKLDFDEKF